MEAASENFYLKLWRLSLVLDSANPPGGGGGYSGFQVTGMIEGFFGV